MESLPRVIKKKASGMRQNDTSERLQNDTKSVVQKRIFLFKRNSVMQKYSKSFKTAAKSTMFFFSYLHFFHLPQQALSIRPSFCKRLLTVNQLIVAIFSLLSFS